MAKKNTRAEPTRNTGYATLAQAAKFLNIHRTTAWRMCQAKQIENFKVRSEYRIPWRAIYELVGE